MGSKAQRWSAAGRELAQRDPHRFDVVLAIAETYVKVYRRTDAARRGFVAYARQRLAAAVAIAGGR